MVLEEGLVPGIVLQIEGNVLKFEQKFHGGVGHESSCDAHSGGKGGCADPLSFDVGLVVLGHRQWGDAGETGGLTWDDHLEVTGEGVLRDS